jgi:hypothetical protein
LTVYDGVNVKTMDAAEAQVQYAAGRVRLRKAERIAMVAPDGVLKFFPAESVAEALSARWRFATARDRDERESRRRDDYLSAAAALLGIPLSVAALYYWGLWLVGSRKAVDSGRWRIWVAVRHSGGEPPSDGSIVRTTSRSTDQHSPRQ